MLEQNKISFGWIELNRGISQITGNPVIDHGPMFEFIDEPGDRTLHERFIELYKSNEINKTKTSKNRR